MAGGLGDRRGGIFGLVELLDEHQEAVEYDLISHGLRLRQLGTEALTWRDLKILLEYQPPERSALARIKNPEEVAWGLSEHLLATIADGVRARVWQEGSGKSKDRPKPIPRPGIETAEKTTYRYDVEPVAEMAEFLGDGFVALLPAS